MGGLRVVVVGGSAGSLEPLREIASSLSADFPAAVFFVQHLPSNHSSILPSLLQPNSRLRVVEGADSMPIEPGTIYTATADRHLLLRDGAMLLSRGPRENGARPAIDALFRSAAVAHGPAATGVILSGMLDDGVSGLMAVKRCGGTTIVQDPSEAQYPEMPTSAIDGAMVDEVLPVAGIVPLLERVVRAPIGPATDIPEDLKIEVRIAEHGTLHINTEDAIGERTELSCPDCGGPIWEIEQSPGLRYRCQVGHGHTIRSMLGFQDEGVERALWMAIRTLEERSKLLEKLAREVSERGFGRSAESYRSRYEETREHADVLRRLLLGGA